MRDAARTPLSIQVAAVALLGGAGVCLALPALPPWPWLTFALVAGLVSWLSLRGWQSAIGVVLLGFGLAGLHATVVLERQLPNQYERADAVISGRVAGLPEHGTRSTGFLFRVDTDDTQPAHLRGRLLRLAWYDQGRDRQQPRGADVRQPRDRIEAGSRWQLHVRLRAPRGLRNPGGFDSEKHALAKRIAASGYVRDAETARQLAPATGIDAWRARMSARIGDAVTGDAARFVRALALGDTRGLDARDWDTLRSNGLTHLVAISGFHVGLVAGFFALLAAGVWWLFPLLGRHVPRPQAAACAALLGAFAYAAVAGFALPTLRTVLMIAVIVLARLARRAQGGFEALALAAIAIVLVDPLALLGAGFWLSFAGVAWLLWCLPRTAARQPLRGLLNAQGVATLGLLPLTVVLFHQASLVGPLANLVAVPWWSLVVVPLALIGTGLEALFPGAGAWAWQLAAQGFDLSWPLFVWLDASGLALWWLPQSPWFALPLALLGAFWLLLPRGVPGKPLALLLWLPLLWPASERPAPGAAQLQVIDVGQGLSVLVRTHGHALLYDMGPAREDGFDAGERAVVPTMRALGVHTLDAAIISHGDNDHAGGWEAVSAVFPADTVYAPEGSPAPGDSFCRAGDAWQWDGVRFRFLHPARYFPYLDNESSCVLRIETAHGTALLTGDIGEVVQRSLLRDHPEAIRVDVVLVPHHGSKSGSDPSFVRATGARFALVSAAFDSRFGHPAPEVVTRWQASGATLLNTAESGALRVALAQDGLTVRGERAARPRLWDAARR